MTLEPGVNCWKMAGCERFGVLVDGQSYFEALASSLAKARRRIALLGWDFDSRTFLRPQKRRRRRLPIGEFLRDLVERTRTLEIEVLVWWGSVFYGCNPDLPVSLGDAWWSHPRIRFRLDDHHPLGACHHQKVVCIDDKVAFVGGIDITQCRWDLRKHKPVEVRRRDHLNAPYAPVHDLQAVVDGDAARAIAELVSERWRVLTGAPLEPLNQVAGDPWPDDVKPLLERHPVAIARTQPLLDAQPEAREIEAINLACIERAERFVYIEAQYFTIPQVAERLAAQLEAPHGPEVVIIANNVSSGWVEQQAMFENRDRLFSLLRRADRHDRLRTFFPVACRDPACCIKVHSKLLIVDDKFVRLGSSNLNSRSLGVDTECDLVLEADTPEARRAIARLSTVLLAEHLDVRPRRLTRALQRHGSVLRAIDALNRKKRGLMPYDVAPATGSVTLMPGSPLLDPPRAINLKYLWNWLASAFQ